MRKKKIDGLTFIKLELNQNYGSHNQYYIGDVKDYFAWEIPKAERIAELTSGTYYAYIYKLGTASYLFVVVEAEKSDEEVEIVIEKKGKILCKLTIPKHSYIEFGDGEDIGATVYELVRKGWALAFY
ncbi:hypothetical protein [uncultured virus]|uniref:Uncharacterized protein n=1 Tax=uncultured virus TaxID=340016 RepID=A0A5Q0TWH9_9VIRU|nr:hypothetical protein [uncultured virus]